MDNVMLNGINKTPQCFFGELNVINISQIIKGVNAKNLKPILLLDFSEVFDSIHRGKKNRANTSSICFFTKKKKKKK